MRGRTCPSCSHPPLPARLPNRLPRRLHLLHLLLLLLLLPPLQLTLLLLLVLACAHCLPAHGGCSLSFCPWKQPAGAADRPADRACCCTGR